MLKRIGAEESGEFKAIASGTLPSGKPVVVNSDGTVSVAGLSGTTGSSGTKVAFDGDPVEGLSVVYDSSNNKVVAIYSDNDNSKYGTAAVGTVDNSDNSISFGTPVVFNSGNSQKIGCTFDSNSNKVIALWHQVIGTTGKGIVGTVSGTSISFGSAADFTQNSIDYEINATFDSNLNKVAVVYHDSGDSGKGKCAIGTVSGTSISFGTPVTFRNAATYFPDVCFDSNLNCILVFYQTTSDDGYISIGDISGTSVTFTTEISLGNDAEKTFCEFDPTSNKVVLAYTDRPDGESAAAKVATISGSSGSRTVSFGTEVNFATGVSQNCVIKGITYDPDSNRMLISYFEESGGNLKLASGTVSGTDISFGTPQTVVNENTSAVFAPVVYDTSQDRAVVVYEDGQNSDAATAIVATVDTVSTNLTSENYIGMSRGVAVQTGSNTSAGTAATFASGESIYMNNALTFDSNSNKLVVAFRNSSSGDNGFAAVGTVSGTDISFGTPVAYNSGSSSTNHNTAVFDSNTNRVVIAYQDGGNSSYGTAIVGEVSGTSISFGTEVVFESANSQKMASAFDSNSNKVVIAYADSGNSGNGTAIVGTVDSSDNSISFGSPVVFQSSNTEQISAAFDSNSNKVVISYSTGPGKAIVGTVSGTSISFGSAATFESSSTVTYTATTFDSNLNKIVVAYRDGNNSGYGTAAVGTVSGTDISFGTPVVFEEADIEHVGIAFDSSANKVVIGYRDTGNSDYGTSVTGTVSGTSISFDPAIVYEQARATYNAGAFDSNSNKVVFVYSDGGNSSHGTGVVFTTSTLAINRAEVANSDNASIDIIGSVSDNQLGLTAGQQYFVQTDGTIGTTADSPSVLAGTAISATELLVKT